MDSITPNPKKRGYMLPKGCKDLVDVLHGKSLPLSLLVNEKIRSGAVQVIGLQGEILGIKRIAEAIGLARSLGIELVEIAPNAKPPICRIVDYSGFGGGTSKRRKSQP